MKPKPTKLKAISWNTGLQARALFAMGADSFKRAAQFEKALQNLLNLDETGTYCGHLSDAMVDGDDGFEEALKKQGYVIAKPKRSNKRKSQ